MLYSATKPGISARIDWSDPLAQGLVGCWLYHTKGRLLNLVDNVGVSPFQSGAGGTLSEVTNGVKFEPADSSNGLSHQLNSMASKIPTNQGTLFIKFTPDNRIAGEVHLISILASSGNGRKYIYGSVSGSNFTCLYSCNSSNPVASMANVAIGAETTMAMTWRNNGLNCSGFVNGKLLVQGTPSLSPVGSHDYFSIGRYAGAGNMFSGVIHCVAAYARELSPTEIQQLHEMTKGW